MLAAQRSERLLLHIGNDPPAATVHRQLASIVEGSRDVKWSSLQRTQQLWQQEATGSKQQWQCR